MTSSTTFVPAAAKSKFPLHNLVHSLNFFAPFTDGFQVRPMSFKTLP